MIKELNKNIRTWQKSVNYTVIHLGGISLKNLQTSSCIYFDKIII